MKICVLTDTHDQYHNIQKAVAVLNEKHVEFVIHCGDWVSPFTLKFYEGLKCPIKGASFAVYDTKTNTAELIRL